MRGRAGQWRLTQSLRGKVHAESLDQSVLGSPEPGTSSLILIKDPTWARSGLAKGVGWLDLFPRQ